MVQIVLQNRHCTPVRVLIDHGSELSFVCESLIQMLQLRRQHAKIPILGIGSRPAGSTRGALSLRLRSCLDSSVELDVFAYILPHLTGNIPSSRLDTHSWNHISGLSLTDPKYAIPAQVDLVLGTDVIGYLL
jgi:hypothetical protein